MNGRLVHLLRHGETPRTGHLIGSTDCPVSEAGIAACRDRVSGLAFDRIVASDLIRASACAEAIGGVEYLSFPQCEHLESVLRGTGAGNVRQPEA